MIVSDRVAFKQLCVTTLNAHFPTVSGLEAVTAFYGDPGENITDHAVVLGLIEGNSTAEVFGPAGSSDEFTIASAISTVGHATEQAADEFAQLILNEINAALFQTHFAASLGARVFPGKQDGPNGIGPMDGQAASSAVEIQIAARIAVRGS